jgi:uracil-DNA glycosylase
MKVPPSWLDALAPSLSRPSFRALAAFLDEERRTKTIFPPAHEVFAALEHTPLPDVKVVLLGQDPYHDDGQAHGLCFSVRPPTPPPPSLRNIFKELEADLGIAPPSTGDLTPWARRGVLLLNAVLTVEAHQPASHQKRGWEELTDDVIRAVAARSTHTVFCLWGSFAKKKAALVDASRHTVIMGAHPSPLSARLFFGSRPFSAMNRALVEHGQEPIDWRLSPTS